MHIACAGVDSDWLVKNVAPVTIHYQCGVSKLEIVNYHLDLCTLIYQYCLHNLIAHNDGNLETSKWGHYW